MKKGMIRGAIIVCILQILLILSACTNQNSEKATGAKEENWSYSGKYVCTGYEKIPWREIGQDNRVLACSGELVYSCENRFYYEGQSIVAQSIADLVEDYDQFEVKTEVYRQTIEGKRLSEQIPVCELEGYAIKAIVYENKDLILTLAGSADYLGLREEGYLVRVSEDGQILFRRELENGTWAGSLTVNGKGDLLLLSDNKVSVYNKKGKKTKIQKLNTTAYGMDICGDRADGFYLISMERGPLTKKVHGEKEEIIDDKHNFLEFSRTEDGRTLASNGEKVYLYSENGNEWQELFDIVSLDVCTQDIVKWWMDEKKKVYLIVRDDGVSEEYLVTAERMPEEEIPKKEVIRLGTNGNLLEVQRAVVNFNRSSEKYRVEVTNYAGMLGMYSDSSDYSAVEKRFRLDLYSGKEMDLVFTNLLSCYGISPKGLLEDLTPYLEQSDRLSAEEFFPEVLQAATYNGDLTYLSNSFHISTLLCKASLEGAYKDEWTVDNLFELAGNYPEAYLFPLVRGDTGTVGEHSAQCVMENVLLLDGGRIFAGDTFDKKTFVKLLSKSKEAYDARNQGTAIREELNQKKLLFVNADIWKFSDLTRCFAEDFAKKDMMAIGYPMESGQGKSVMEPCNGIGILASSEHREAAWAFLEFYIPFSDRGDTDYLSTRKSVFEKQIKKAYQYAQQDLGLDDGNYMEEEALNLLEEMLGNAVGSDQKIEAEILQIIREETPAYYAGDRSAEAVADSVGKRVRLYLNENGG